MASKVIKNSYWVIPGEIMAGPFPGSSEDFNAKLRVRSLFDAGIRAFINLQEEGEMVARNEIYNENYWDFFRLFLKNSGEEEIEGFDPDPDDSEDEDEDEDEDQDEDDDPELADGFDMSM